MKRTFWLLFILSFGTFLNAQTLAFPGAEGGGKFTTGGRGGKLFFVENLNDKGEGSLRKAIEAEGPRTVIFRVSGNIELQKPIYIKNGDLTIAGQTAPGDGICLKNFGIKIEADNVIIRFIRVRPGDLMHEENDAISGIRNKNIIVDHCSFSWSNDEVASFYDNIDFTLQWCIISESLYHSAHHKGDHGYGGIWGGSNASFHHNLLSDHTSRNPRLCGSRYTRNAENEKADITNNVIYNWGYNSAYGGEEGNYNIVNNYYKPGTATRKNVSGRILQLTPFFFDPNVVSDSLFAGNFYVAGNYVENNRQASENNWDFGVDADKKFNATKVKSKLDKPVFVTSFVTDSAKDAFKKVLKVAGASLVRDEVDTRIITETESGKEKYGISFDGGKNGIIDSQTDVGGWPVLQSKTAPVDSDNDGMPDEWEKKNGIDPIVANNNKKDLDSEFTNIEVYINSLVSNLIF